jgi:uncharacterized membrane-anchored protein
LLWLGFGFIERRTIMSHDSTITNVVEKASRKMDWKCRGGIILGILLQLGILGGMIVFKAGPLITGETVWLRVVPVDPRDLFRGDYVSLGYDFTQISPQDLPELGTQTYRNQHEWEGTPVYVTLVPEEDGKHWRKGTVTTKRPTEGKYLCGTLNRYHRIACGIESYYVQEDAGREFEEAARGNSLSAEIALTSDGRAVLRELHIGPRKPTPHAGPTYDPQIKYRWPNERSYRVQYVPNATVKLDGSLSEPAWQRANVERDFVFPWKKAEVPPTEFMAFYDDQFFYFAFRAVDADIVTLDKLRDKRDVVFEDRVEIFVSRDNEMKDYYCLEMDPRGRTFDYQMAYYRKMDEKWRCEGLETVGVKTDNGYIVEGRMPLTTLAKMGNRELRSPAERHPLEGAKLLCGLYRAEFSHDPNGKPAAPEKSLHHGDRSAPGIPPIEEWISWIDPKTPEPDFHVPSSLGHLEFQ